MKYFMDGKKRFYVKVWKDYVIEIIEKQEYHECSKEKKLFLKGKFGFKILRKNFLFDSHIFVFNLKSKH